MECKLRQAHAPESYPLDLSVICTDNPSFALANRSIPLSSRLRGFAIGHCEGIHSVERSKQAVQAIDKYGDIVV